MCNHNVLSHPFRSTPYVQEDFYSIRLSNLCSLNRIIIIHRFYARFKNKAIILPLLYVYIFINTVRNQD